MLGGNGNQKGSGQGYGDWSQKDKDEWDDLKRREELAKRRTREAKDKILRAEAERKAKKERQ